jgi:hypothetical protein
MIFWEKVQMVIEGHSQAIFHPTEVPGIHKIANRVSTKPMVMLWLREIALSLLRIEHQYPAGP